MDQLKSGEFYGSHYQKLTFDDVEISDTEYTHDRVDWHYHENSYFTYLLQGKLFEENKKESYYLTPGSLLFHNWQDAHYNIKPPGYARGFHIEINPQWLAKHEVSSTDFEGSINLKSPSIKGLMNKIFLETQINDNHSQASIELLLLSVFNNMKSSQPANCSKTPSWVRKLNEIIEDSNIDYSLTQLSKELNIHPGHLSREFHRYFGSTLGQYLRLSKVNKAVTMIIANQLSLTEICYKCGFYDQSHFIVNFKRVHSTTPSKFLSGISQR